MGDSGAGALRFASLRLDAGRQALLIGTSRRFLSPGVWNTPRWVPFRSRRSQTSHKKEVSRLGPKHVQPPRAFDSMCVHVELHVEYRSMD